MELMAETLGRRYFRQGRGRNFFWAAREVSLTLRGGRLTVVTGRSGSGKSTLLHMLSGLLAPDEGRVLLDGEDLYALDDEARSRRRGRAFGIIPQGQTALRSLTVWENIRLPSLLHGEPFPDERAAALLDRLGIAPLRDAYPEELSGGEMRRLAIARALAPDPGVILADEPTGDLDDENTRAVLALLRERADAGAAVLLVTHEREAIAYADEAYIMREGTLSPAE